MSNFDPYHQYTSDYFLIIVHIMEIEKNINRICANNNNNLIDVFGFFKIFLL